LFATHYHELVDLARDKERVANYNIAVREWEDRIVFLRKILPGGTSRSYGIQVARLAGIPDSVIERAKEILVNLESEEIDPAGRPRLSRQSRKKGKPSEEAYQPELFGYRGDDLLKELVKIDANNITPLDALKLIAEWKNKFD